MIGDFFFFVKTVILTFVFVVFLQVKVGDYTLEQRAANWARGSQVVQPLREAAHGGVIALREVWREVLSLMSGKVQDTFQSEDSPGRRSLGINFERSKAFLKKQAKKAQQVARRNAEEAELVIKEKAIEAEALLKEKAHQATDELFEELKREGFSSDEE